MTSQQQKIVSTLEIATFNVNSIRQQRKEIIHFLSDHDIDILLVQEILPKSADGYNLPNYDV